MAAYHAKSQEDNSLLTADAFIFVNSHTGRPNAFSNWLDPAVTHENDPVKTDPSLNMYHPANRPPYSQEFIQRYRTGQVDRNYRFTQCVKQELQRLNDAGIPDRIFPIHRTMADLRFMDAMIDPSGRPIPRCYFGDAVKANHGIGLAGRSSSLHTWLSLWGLQESKIKLEVFAANGNMPKAVINGTADVGVFNSDARNIFNNLVTKDKELHFIPGGHSFDDSQDDFDGVIKPITNWVEKRFPSANL